MINNVQDELSWHLENFEEHWYKDELDSDFHLEIFNLNNEKLTCILSSDKLNVKNEKIVWNVIRDWVSFEGQSGNRLKHLLNLIRDCLRIGRLPRGFIDEKIINSHLVMVLSREEQQDLEVFINVVFQDEQIKKTTTDGFNLPYSPTTTYFRPRETKQLLVCISKCVEFFDYQRNSWHLSSFEPPTRLNNFHFELLDVCKSTLYAFGGCDQSNKTSNKMWSLDLSQPLSQWTAMTPMNLKRTDFSSIVLNNNIFALGGKFTGVNLQIHTLNSCERYDSHLNIWSTIAPMNMNIARYSASATVYNGCIYIAGGCNENDEIERSVEKYDPQANTWTQVASMSTARSYFALTLFADALWAIGGHDGKQTLSSVESFNSITNKWQTKMPLEEGRFHHSAIDFRGELLVIGGNRNTVNYGKSKLNVSDQIKTVEKYKPDEGWCQNSMFQKTHLNAKLLIVPNAYSTIFTSNSNVFDNCNKKKMRKEINLLLLGETGAGKSTTLNALANYLKFNSFENAINSTENFIELIPSQFSISDSSGKEWIIKSDILDSNERHGSGNSVTICPTEYVFNFGKNILRIIDTPGMGDTGGAKNDKNNFDQILITLQQFKNLHGIIFVVNGTSNRKTLFFKYCITQLLTYLHRSIVDNIFFCFTYSTTGPGTFGPGEGFGVLKSFLEEDLKLEVEIKLEPSKNTFFIENEAYRYLVAQNQGYPLSAIQKMMLPYSWNFSVQEFEKLFSKIFLVLPHNSDSTVSLNNARKIAMDLSKPILQLSQQIEDNIKVIEEKEKKINFETDNKNKLRSGETVSFTIKKYQPNDYSNVICVDCEKVCCEKCETRHWLLVDKASWCHKMINGICKICNCSWRKHSVEPSKFVDVVYTQTNQAVVNQIKEIDSGIKEQKNQINETQNFVDELKSEKEIINEIGTKFAYFIKKNSTVVFNRFFEELIDKQIEEENTKSKPNTEHLYRLKREHLDNVELLTKAIADNSQTEVTMHDIHQMQKSLLHLKHTGSIFEKIFHEKEKMQKSLSKNNVFIIDESDNKIVKLIYNYFNL